jgi:sigma-54 dependent transcriptional regulator, acetoin dehydrogenase operon transcriptional activator AcoR
VPRDFPQGGKSVEQQHSIRLAWESFLLKGKAPQGIPQTIASSWKRSRTLGVAVERGAAPLAGEPEVFRRRSQNAMLLTAARPALQRSSLFLAEASSMMILSDPSGFIIETAGDPRILDQGRRNHLEIGGNWEEGAIGTNAIGTALAEGRAIHILGAEHFCEDVQRWACAATPVRYPGDGELLGVVDISGPARTFNPQSLALAVAISREMEASLDQALKLERDVLWRYFVSKRSIWLSEEMLLVDSRGSLVHATQKALRTLDGSQPQTPDAIRAVVRTTPETRWADGFRQQFPNANLEVVKNEGQAIGCVVVLHHSRSRLPAPALRTASNPSVGFDQILGESAAIREARERARKLAVNTLPILIEGETGVGKELFARAIKGAGPNAEGPFVPVNCGGIPHDLIASELFGYAKGAFTGADEHGRAGKIEKASGGVLCLDEIGEMPLDLQAYLLRVLEDHMVYRIGEHEGRTVDIQILSMTNRGLAAEVEAGRFRRDLYHRIAGARVRIPPLRERGDDILLLAERFATAAADKLGRVAVTFSTDAAALMMAYRWPGNVRELRNVVETTVALVESGLIEVDDLPDEVQTVTPGSDRTNDEQLPPVAGDLREAERQAILTQVRACDGNLTQAARRLGIARSTLYLRLAKYGGRPTLTN